MTKDRAPFLFVIIGGTGDLSRKKILPSLFRLAQRNRLGEHYCILGASPGEDLDDASFQKMIAQSLEGAGAERRAARDWTTKHLRYEPIRPTGPKGYASLRKRVEALEKDLGSPGNRVLYLAVPSEVFGETVRCIAEAQLNGSDGWVRIVVEKPFGQDLESAERLDTDIHDHFDESQIYRIDHYLGKETVQNLLILRFANAMLEWLWNRDRIEHVQITVAESLGVESRGRYYDEAGALRDMVQNHITQLVSFIAMEVPVGLDADSIKAEKLKLLKSIRPIETEDVIFGQYTRGTVDGAEVCGYREEAAISPESSTETFVALRLWIDNWRWHGVPFYVRTGKRLSARTTQILVKFREPPATVFRNNGWPIPHRNGLVMRLQPNEGFTLEIDVKVPNAPLTIRTVPLHFEYEDAFQALPDAYETLLLQILDGDQTLFVHSDEVTASWRIYMPVLRWPRNPQLYPAGSWGPSDADKLLARDGHLWRNPENGS